MSDQSQHETYFTEFGDQKRQRASVFEADTEPLLQPPVVSKPFFKRRRFYRKSTYLDLLSSRRPYVSRKAYKRRPRRVIKPVARVTCSCSVSHSPKRFIKRTSKRVYRKR